MVGNSVKCHREVKQATLQSIPWLGPLGAVPWSGAGTGQPAWFQKAGRGEKAGIEHLPPVSRALAEKGARKQRPSNTQEQGRVCFALSARRGLTVGTGC